MDTLWSNGATPWQPRSQLCAQGSETVESNSLQHSRMKCVKQQLETAVDDTGIRSGRKYRDTKQQLALSGRT